MTPSSVSGHVLHFASQIMIVTMYVHGVYVHVCVYVCFCVCTATLIVFMGHLVQGFAGG